MIKQFIAQNVGGGSKRINLNATLIYKGVDPSETYTFGDAVGDDREYYRLELQATDTTLSFWPALNQNEEFWVSGDTKERFKDSGYTIADSGSTEPGTWPIEAVLVRFGNMYAYKTDTGQVITNPQLSASLKMWDPNGNLISEDPIPADVVQDMGDYVEAIFLVSFASPDVGWDSLPKIEAYLTLGEETVEPKYSLDVVDFSIQNMDMAVQDSIYTNENVNIEAMSIGIMRDSSETEEELVYPVTWSGSPVPEIAFGNTEVLINALNYTPKVSNYTIYGFTCRFQNVLYNSSIGAAYTYIKTMGGVVGVRWGYGSLTDGKQVNIKDTDIGLTYDGYLYFKIKDISIPVKDNLMVQLDTPSIIISEIS